MCRLRKCVTALPTAWPRCSADKLSVSVCLIACLGGILTEFQLEFALIELQPGLQKAEQSRSKTEGGKRGGGWKTQQASTGSRWMQDTHPEGVKEEKKKSSTTTTKRTHNHVCAHACNKKILTLECEFHTSRRRESECVCKSVSFDQSEAGGTL